MSILKTIETKGDNTKIMADCLRFTEQLMTEVHTGSTTESKNNENVENK